MIVHPVELVSRKDELIVVLKSDEPMQVLTHGIRRTLEPIRIRHRLLGRKDFDESSGEGIEPVAVDDVMIQRGRIELRENENLLEARVQTIADRDIDQPVLAADRHGRLRSQLRQGKEPGPLAPTEDQRENFCIHQHLRAMLHRTGHVVRVTSV